MEERELPVVHGSKLDGSNDQSADMAREKEVVGRMVVHKECGNADIGNHASWPDEAWRTRESGDALGDESQRHEHKQRQKGANGAPSQGPQEEQQQ